MDPENGYGCCGVFGGWPYLVMQHFIKVGGVASEEEYPYCLGSKDKDIKCYPCSPAGYNKTACGPGLTPPACDGTTHNCRENNGLKYTAKISDWKAISSDENDIA